MKIWLASTPRSGNTDTRALLKRLYGLHHVSIYDEITKISLTDKNRPFKGEAAPGHLEMKANQPVFIKTLEMPNDKLPAIYLVRDGLDALVSSRRRSPPPYE
jgi:hypothetical protein